MFLKLKYIIISLGLKNLISKLLYFYAKHLPNHTCTRNGIRYSLNLTEAIDFATYFGGWEPETINFIENQCQQGSHVIEVGANVGIQTLHLAKKVGVNGLVFAFEPTEFALNKLQINCQLNPTLSSRVRIFKNLVTDGDHSTPVNTIRSSWQTNQSRNNDEFINSNLATSLDEFITHNQLNKFDILKIDVDGYDFKVLKGAKKSISKFKPLIYIELGEVALNKQGDSVRDIFNILFELGYVGRSAQNPNQILDLDMTLDTLKTTTHLNAIFAPTN